jgi:hypothetical protein
MTDKREERRGEERKEDERREEKNMTTSTAISLIVPVTNLNNKIAITTLYRSEY